MTTTTLKLDSNYNSIITEEKIRLNNPEDSIYKNANRFKHNDIVFLPSKDEINEILVSISKFPLRFKNVAGTKRFKEMKDYLLTYNLLQQYFSSHSEDKSLIALDSRYLGKALGSRFLNNQNSFFKLFFKLEIKGKKGNYTSGFSILKSEKIGVYSKVIHKNKLDSVILSILDNTYNEENINDSISIKNIAEIINDSFITIPEENIKLLDIFKGTKYEHKINLIISNYKNGKLYYNKDYKPYGRNYSYIHSLPREVRTALFDGFTELDLGSAAQTILLRKAQNKIDDELFYITDYVNNKNEVRQKISLDLGLNMTEVKELIQIVTFNSNIPSESQINFFKSFKKYKQCLNNEFINGLSKDLSTIDKYLASNISDEDKKIIKDFKGRITNIDIRVQTFQSIESKIMKRIQSMLSEESFHLHDAVYVKNIKENEIEEINKYALKNEIIINNIILVFKKYRILQEFKNSDINIKSQQKLEEYIDFCLEQNIGNKIISETEHHHILPDGLFPNFSNLNENKFNGTHLTFDNHYKAHSLLVQAISNPSMVFAWNSMNNMNVKNNRISNPEDLIGSEMYSILRKEYLKNKRIWDYTEIILEDGTVSTNAKENARKAAISRKKLTTDITGNIITIQELSNRRCSETKNKEFILNGEITTNAKESTKRLVISNSKKSVRYNIFKDGKIVIENIMRKDMIKISQLLLKTGSENKLGNSKVSADRFIRQGKGDLIGLYSLKI